jgi:hypothetical protein
MNAYLPALALGSGLDAGGGYGPPAGTWLMVGAAFVVTAMVQQDLATAGVGIADNAAAIGLAAAMWQAGRAERQRVRPGA